MSYLLNEDGERIVEEYPGDVALIVGAFYDKETNELEPWRSIPRNTDLSTYMRVAPGHRRGSAVREYRVLYQPTIRPHVKINCPWSVTLALYGFIDSMNLSITGNWDQTLQGAPKALQWIKLTGGRFDSPFREQGLALSSVEQHVIGTIRGCGLPLNDQEAMATHRQKELKIGRRVFDKVTAATPPSISTIGSTAKIDHKWRITSTPKLGYRQEDMQVKSCNAARFSPGDFVQTVVKVVALVKSGKYNNAPVTVDIRLDLLSCVRLLTSKEANATMPKTAQAQVTEPSIQQDNFDDAVDNGPDMI